MDHGTGLDLWRHSNGELFEERHLKSGGRHGFERLWGDGNTRVWSEQHFHDGLSHGIERRWNAAAKLKFGYPRYYVRGERVTKRQYLRAAKNDPTLPPFRPEENRPERTLPPEYFETMPPAVPPRMPANPEEWRP